MPVNGPYVHHLQAAAPVAVSVGVTSTPVLPENGLRVSLRIVNTSSNVVSFGIGAPAVLNSGLTLMPNGGTWNMDSFDYTTKAINAIAAGAGSNLSVQEYN